MEYFLGILAVVVCYGIVPVFLAWVYFNMRHEKNVAELKKQAMLPLNEKTYGSKYLVGVSVGSVDSVKKGPISDEELDKIVSGSSFSVLEKMMNPKPNTESFQSVPEISNTESVSEEMIAIRTFPGLDLS